MGLIETLLAVEVLVAVVYFLLRREPPMSLARSIIALLLPLAIAGLFLPGPAGVEAAYAQLEDAYRRWTYEYVVSGAQMAFIAAVMDAQNTAMIFASFGVTAILKALVNVYTIARMNPWLDAVMSVNAASQAFMMISQLFKDVVWYAKFAWPLMALGYALVIPRRIRAMGALLIALAIALLTVAKIGGQYAGAAIEAVEAAEQITNKTSTILNSTPLETYAMYYISSPVPTLLLTPVKTSLNWMGMLFQASDDLQSLGCEYEPAKYLASGITEFFMVRGNRSTVGWSDAIRAWIINITLATHIWHVYYYRTTLEEAVDALNSVWPGLELACDLPNVGQRDGMGAIIHNGTWKWFTGGLVTLEYWGIAAPNPLVDNSWIAAFTSAMAALPVGNLAIEYPRDRGPLIIDWLDYNATLTATPIKPLSTVINPSLMSGFNATQIEAARRLQGYYFNATVPFGAWRAYEIALPTPLWWLLTPAENAVYAWDMIFGWAWHAFGNPTSVVGSFGWLYPPSAASYPDRVIWHGQNGQLVLTLALKASYGRPNVVNFTHYFPNATLHYYNVTVQLRHWRETCTWCAEWVNGTCAEWKTSSRNIDEKYRLDPREVTLIYNYNLTLYYAPWRTTWTSDRSLTQPFGLPLRFEVPAIDYSVVKWEEYGPWDNGEPDYASASCTRELVSITNETVKAVRPIEKYVVIAAWAWLNKTRLAFNAPPAPSPPVKFNGSLVWPRPLQSVVCKHDVLDLDIPPAAERLIGLAAFANSTVYSLNYNLSRIYAQEAELWRDKLPKVNLGSLFYNLINPELPKITIFQMFASFNATPLAPPLGYSLYEPYVVCLVAWLLPRGYNATGLIELWPASPWSYHMPIAYTPEMELMVNATLAFALSQAPGKSG